MELGLAGKVAVVTGGSVGIGLATARQFLREGACVAICARGEDRLREAAAQFTEEFKGTSEVYWTACDVVDRPAVEAFICDVGKRFGGIDILVNNAGGGRWSTLASTTDEDWKSELELKFFGLLNPTRAALEPMRQRGGGCIVNVNAIAAREPLPHLVATSAARAGLLNLTRSMANELAADGIRVNGVNLGVILTDQWRRRHTEQAPHLSLDEWERTLAEDRKIPLRRFGRPDEVASAIVFLCSDQATYITGASLDIGGGVHRYV